MLSNSTRTWPKGKMRKIGDLGMCRGHTHLIRSMLLGDVLIHGRLAYFVGG
ncbi:uncharacterized protein J3R85_009784 [Psidium guajava]|nr:uncharacterized protein J3R85_009784 [Psidium guajava]